MPVLGWRLRGGAGGARWSERWSERRSGSGDRATRGQAGRRPTPAAGVNVTGGLKVYLCLHDTAPPEGQIVKTDTDNILIRALQLNKHKSEAKDVSCKTPGESSRGKRNAVRSLDGKNPPKRPNIGGGSSARESSSGFSELTLQSFTVEKLRSLLKERGLSPKGKKDELIARLREASG